MTFEPLSPTEQAKFVQDEMEKLADQYVIRRNGSYFRPNAAGYAASILDAGLYSRSDAQKFRSSEGVSVVPFTECLKQIEGEIAAAQARLEALRTMKACIEVRRRTNPTAPEADR